MHSRVGPQATPGAARRIATLVRARLLQSVLHGIALHQDALQVRICRDALLHQVRDRALSAQRLLRVVQARIAPVVAERVLVRAPEPARIEEIISTIQVVAPVYLIVD